MSHPDDFVVENLPDAERVLRAMRALIAVLVRDDARVQRFLQAWAERPHLPADNQSMRRDTDELRALVHELRLSEYQWLPSALFKEFVGWSVELPAWTTDAPWASKGRRPKDGPKQREDLERNVEWFYRTRVKEPPDSEYAVGKEYAARENLTRRSQHSTIQAGIKRVRDLLACIDAPMPK